MGYRRGMDCKLYYKEGGQGESGDWLELTNAQDVTLGQERDAADATTRGNNGYEAEVVTLKKAPVSWRMIFDPDDPAYVAISTAYHEGSLIGLQVLTDTEANGGKGLQADFNIKKFTRNEALRDVVTVDVEASIAYSADPPVEI